MRRDRIYHQDIGMYYLDVRSADDTVYLAKAKLPSDPEEAIEVAKDLILDALEEHLELRDEFLIRSNTVYQALLQLEYEGLVWQEPDYYGSTWMKA